MPQSNSLNPAPLKITKIHTDSVRPHGQAAPAVQSGRDGSYMRVGPLGANQPAVYGGKR